MARTVSAGFTLIEILVVLVIIGVIVALAAVRFGEPADAALEREADRLALLLETARDEAIAGGQPLAWGWDARGYRFYQRGPDGLWRVLDTNEVLRERAWPEGLKLQEVRVNLQRLGSEDKLRFSPSGVNAPFSLLLANAQHQRRLSGDAMGRMTVRAETPDHTLGGQSGVLQPAR